MKLTKLQRYTAYCFMLEEIEQEYNCICSVAAILFDVELDEDFRFTNFKTIFPELWAKRLPGRNEYSSFLWSCGEQRIEALKQCIIETHP